MSSGGRGKRTRRKQGKERLDRYYHLAKEQGYRARSAFKLIQLSQRFSIFQRPRLSCGVPGSPDAAIVDLCAAPGGWLQVCTKHAPVATRILGIDLVPIKAIRGVETLTEDITRPSLPAKIKKLLQGAEVWLVLHDGSPNMGTEWSIDAFNQNVLVLSALRTAALILCEGGTFVSKVFRSQDYAALLFVLQSLFAHVHATKPLASRNVSAEIFVVCQGYKKPAVLDHRLFDPKSVFLTDGADDSNTDSLTQSITEGRLRESTAAVVRGTQEGRLTEQQSTGGERERLDTSKACSKGSGEQDDSQAEDALPSVDDETKGEGDDWLASSLHLNGGGIFGKGKKGIFAELVRQQARRHRQRDPATQLRRVTVQEFFNTEDPATLLVSQAREMYFQEPPSPLEKVVKEHALTTEEILRFIGDVQVLGKSELVAVLKWRFRVMKALVLQRRAARKPLEGLMKNEEEDGKLDGQTLQKGEKRTVQQQRAPDSSQQVGRINATEKTCSDGKRCLTEAEADRHDDDKDSDKEDDDDTDVELCRLSALVRRREEKRRKRVECKEKQRELRLRLSRGGCLDADDTVGHHVDPDLFALPSKTMALLEETSTSCFADDELFQSDNENEKRHKQQRNEVHGVWIEGDSTSEGDAVTEVEDDEKSSSEDASGASSGDEAERVDRLDAEIALSHCLQKLQKAQAGARTKEKKLTRRQKVQSEWATELENFRDHMQAEAAAALARKAGEGAESDSSQDEDDECGRRGAEEDGKRRNDRERNRHRAQISREGSLQEVLDDDEEPSFSDRGDASFNSNILKNCGLKPGVGSKSSKGPRKAAAVEDSDNFQLKADSTTRWFRQRIFDGCQEDTLPAAVSGLQEASAPASASAVRESGDIIGHVGGKTFTRKCVSCFSDVHGNLGYRLKKGRREAGVVGTTELPDEVQTHGEGDGDAEAREGQEDGMITEVDDDTLPSIPVCDKKQRQQRKWEQAQRKERKALDLSKTKRKDTDDVGDDILQKESNTFTLNGWTWGERLQEVPAAQDAGSSRVKRPTDPEELARIQAVGTLLINRTSRMDLIDGAYNRYAFIDDGPLPEWFVEDEKRHNKPQLPLTKELVRQYRQKLLDISRRPIRKVLEARARKRLREKRQLQKVKSQAFAIAESAGFTEAGKARAIEKIARKAGRVKEKSNKQYYVVSRGFRAGGTLITKNKNSSSKYAKTKFVDRRMKKDKRAQKIRASRNGKKITKKMRKGRRRKRNSSERTNSGGPKAKL